MMPFHGMLDRYVMRFLVIELHWSERRPIHNPNQNSTSVNKLKAPTIHEKSKNVQKYMYFDEIEK